MVRLERFRSWDCGEVGGSSALAGTGVIRLGRVSDIWWQRKPSEEGERRRRSRQESQRRPRQGRSEARPRSLESRVRRGEVQGNDTPQLLASRLAFLMLVTMEGVGGSNWTLSLASVLLTMGPDSSRWPMRMPADHSPLLWILHKLSKSFSTETMFLVPSRHCSCGRS